MACHEIAALRIALHSLLGTRPAAELTHEVAELGDLCEVEGPLRRLTQARDLATLRRALEAAVGEHEAQLASMATDDPKLGYHRALVVTVRGALRDVERMSMMIERFYLDIEDTHDLLHEIFPGSDDV
ncbi:MAG: DUF3209 family protein [Deltaproteobacteria bacterium]|nr:DUF3209 family protein [Deltaproteobacteria bacterium]